MALLPRRHPNRDFFVLDISDVVPKDDTASMEHPFFSLATKPDMRKLCYEHGRNKLTIEPSARGLPTIFDKDILIFCISQLMHRKNQGKPIGKKVRFSARELLISTNRPTNNLGYERLESAFSRLRGTNFITNIQTGNKTKTQIFGMIESGGFVRINNENNRLEYCEITLSDWMMKAIESDDVLSLNTDYFRIRRPLERRLYELCRKHCGKQKQWQISLQNLKIKTGSAATIYKFRHNIRQIIGEDHTPDYTLSLSSDDTLTVKQRKANKRTAKDIKIPSWAEDKARIIAREKGWDYYALKREWLDFANNPKNPGAAFVGFCQKKDNLR